MRSGPAAHDTRKHWQRLPPVRCRKWLAFMLYHAPTNQFTIDAEALKRSASLMRYAIKKIRLGSGIDPKGYDNIKREIDAAEYAESAILDAAKALGIHLGADRAGQLDVSNERSC